MAPSLQESFQNADNVDAKTYEFLLKALERNNQPGFDYLEFKQSLNALLKMNMDLPTAMKSAYTTASTMGLTKNKLMDTAEQYKQVLFTERAQFDSALKKQIQQKVDGKKADTDAMKNKILDYREKIRQMEAEIETWKVSIDKSDQEIQESLQLIEGTKSKFEDTFDKLVAQIIGDIDLIKQHV